MYISIRLQMNVPILTYLTQVLYKIKQSSTGTKTSHFESLLVIMSHNESLWVIMSHFEPQWVIVSQNESEFLNKKTTLYFSKLANPSQIISRAVELAGAGNAGGGDLVVIFQLFQAGGNVEVHCLANRIVLCRAVEG